MKQSQQTVVTLEADEVALFAGLDPRRWALKATHIPWTGPTKLQLTFERVEGPVEAQEYDPNRMYETPAPLRDPQNAGLKDDVPF